MVFEHSNLQVRRAPPIVSTLTLTFSSSDTCSGISKVSLAIEEGRLGVEDMGVDVGGDASFRGSVDTGGGVGSEVSRRVGAAAAGIKPVEAEEGDID